METCRSCKWFNKKSDYAEKRCFNPKLQQYPPGDDGMYTLIEIAYSEHTWDTDTVPPVVAPDFGCIHHTPKEPADE